MVVRRPMSLRAQAVGWLAQREYSVSEMRGKLLRRARTKPAARAADSSDDADVEKSTERSSWSASDQQEVDDVIGWLLQSGYLDESRFVASRVHVRAAGHGVARIAQELSRHGLDLPSETAQALRDSELERARAIWQRRFGEPPVDQRAAARQARFLAGRGFSSEVVARILRVVQGSGRRDSESF